MYSLRLEKHSAFQSKAIYRFPEFSVVRLSEYSSSRRSSGTTSFLSALVDIYCIPQDLPKFKIFEFLTLPEK